MRTGCRLRLRGSPGMHTRCRLGLRAPLDAHVVWTGAQSPPPPGMHTGCGLAQGCTQGTDCGSETATPPPPPLLQDAHGVWTGAQRPPQMRMGCGLGLRGPPGCTRDVDWGYGILPDAVPRILPLHSGK